MIHTKMEFTGKSATLYSMSAVLLAIAAGLWSISYVLALKHKSSSPLPPGPMGLPILGNLLRLGALPHRSLQKLAQKYGPIMYMRLGLFPTIVVSSPEAAKLFLNTNDLNFASRPILICSDNTFSGSSGMGASEYGPYWRNVRKLCTVHLLTVAKMESFMPLRREESREFVRSIRQAAKGGDVNISAQVVLVIEKITYGMIFGKGYQEKYNLKPVIEEVLALWGAFNIADFVPAMRRFDVQGFNVRMKVASKALNDFLEKVISEHEKDTSAEYERSFIDILLSVMKSETGEKNLGRSDIKAITFDMVGGAFDTTVTTVEWALSELLRHPRVTKKIQEETTAVIGLDRMVEESDLANLPYLNMVVKETLRLHPPVPLGGPHQSIDDVTVGGYHIPRKSRVIINLWAINRDPNAWSPNAEEFYPERFNRDDRDIRGTDLRFIPFGSGRRKCPGIELGLRTVTFVLAQVVHCFNLDLPKEMSIHDIDMKETFGITAPRANPLLVVPTYRLRH